MFRHLLKRVSRPISRAARDQKANVAIVTAFVIVVLVFAGGSAVDYARATRVKSVMGAALDSAAIAAAKDLSVGSISTAQLTERAQTIFEANFHRPNLSDVQFGSFSLTKNESDATVTVAADAKLQASFMQLAGIDTMDIASRSVATYSDTELEMAFMLDVTGSMAGTKITDLKVAAADAVNILIPKNAVRTDKVRIGLIPYSSSVNAGAYAATATGGLSNRCVTERAPGAGYRDISYLNNPLAAANSLCPDNEVVPLTNDTSRLISEIGNFRAAGLTAGHLGIGWTWYVLSPRWKSLWPHQSQPKSYRDKKILKVAVLMTDGSFNRAYELTDTERQMPTWEGETMASRRQTRKLCTNMKAEGITIYSISFQAPRDAEELLQDCASQASTYFSAEDGAQLRDAFAEIALRTRALYLSR